MSENSSRQTGRYYTALETMAERYERIERKWAFCAKDCGGHQDWCREAQKRLWEIAGINRCLRAEPDPKKWDSVKEEGYSREYWTIRTEPGITMPFYLLRPDKQNGAAMILPHGHGSGKEATVQDMDNPGVQAMKQYFGKGCLADSLAKAGYMVFCPDERGPGKGGRQDSRETVPSPGRAIPIESFCRWLSGSASPSSVWRYGI